MPSRVNGEPQHLTVAPPSGSGRVDDANFADPAMVGVAEDDEDAASRRRRGAAEEEEGDDASMSLQSPAWWHDASPETRKLYNDKARVICVRAALGEVGCGVGLLISFWAAYGWPIIPASLAIVLGTVGYSHYQSAHSVAMNACCCAPISFIHQQTYLHLILAALSFVSLATAIAAAALERAEPVTVAFATFAAVMSLGCFASALASHVFSAQLVRFCLSAQNDRESAHVIQVRRVGQHQQHDMSRDHHGGNPLLPPPVVAVPAGPWAAADHHQYQYHQQHQQPQEPPSYSVVPAHAQHHFPQHNPYVAQHPYAPPNQFGYPQQSAATNNSATTTTAMRAPPGTFIAPIQPAGLPPGAFVVMPLPPGHDHDCRRTSAATDVDGHANGVMMMSASITTQTGASERPRSSQPEEETAAEAAVDVAV